MREKAFIKKQFSPLSFRIAQKSSLFNAFIFILLLNLFTDLSFSAALFISLGAALVCGIATYYFNYKLHHNRLLTLESITKNIARKRFDDYTGLTNDDNDELDKIVKQAVKASRTVEREIQRLNKIENYRKEFIGDISHELKTPIFAIQGFVETLLNGALDDDEVNRVFLNKTMRNVNRLIFLTKDLMEISKLETGELKTNLQDIFLWDIVFDVVESLQYKAQKEDVDIHLENFDRNLQVYADRNQIRQVLINLLENGIKYNRPGGHVEISVEEQKNDPYKVIVHVKDTGIGIDFRDITRVTERFFRVDKSRSREKGGTGLGLAIVKHIIEAHGEKLIIDSTPNKGSSFSFTLTKSKYFTSGKK
ncbi:MAG: sensor histidine kinase [Balneolaceae bacterium]